MPTTVAASDVQKNFGQWHDRALREPVQVTKYGRETVYLVSAETFRAMWSCYRRAVRVEDLTEAEMALIEAAEIAPDDAYSLADLPDEGLPQLGAVTSSRSR
jgi:hypothetical protein